MDWVTDFAFKSDTREITFRDLVMFAVAALNPLVALNPPAAAAVDPAVDPPCTEP